MAQIGPARHHAHHVGRRRLVGHRAQLAAVAVAARQQPLAQIGLDQDGVVEHGAAQGGAAQIGARQVGLAQIGEPQIGGEQAGGLERRPSQGGTLQPRARQVRPGQVAIGQIDARQIVERQIGARAARELADEASVTLQHAAELLRRQALGRVLRVVVILGRQNLLQATQRSVKPKLMKT